MFFGVMKAINFLKNSWQGGDIFVSGYFQLFCSEKEKIE